MPLQINSIDAPNGIAEIAHGLCGAPVLRAELCAGGGNNRVYHIVTATAQYALKYYGPPEPDRDRLGREFDGLRFLTRARATPMLPAALAVDRSARCALYEWVPGTSVVTHDVADVAALLRMLETLHLARQAVGSAEIAAATEAVFRLAELRAQIELRFDRLAAVAAADEPELAAFLFGSIRPEMYRCFEMLGERDVDTELTTSQRTLSPSDVGFHNALRRADGTLTFIDFEYFGWDDPVKLIADVLWHPGMQLSVAERRALSAGSLRLYGADPDFTARLDATYPLYGLRWVLIVLNEFLPRFWERRTFAGKGGDRETAKRSQLLKARSKLAVVNAYSAGDFYV